MPFTSKWLDWTPPETCTQRTDRTDKTPSVSFVSASSKRLEKKNAQSPSHSRPRDPLLAYSFAVEAAAESFPVPGPSRCASCGKRLHGRYIGLLHGARVCNAPELACLTKYGTRRKLYGVNQLRKQGVEPHRDFRLPDETKP